VPRHEEAGKKERRRNRPRDKFVDGLETRARLSSIKAGGVELAAVQGSRRPRVVNCDGKPHMGRNGIRIDAVYHAEGGKMRRPHWHACGNRRKLGIAIAELLQKDDTTEKQLD